MNKREFKQGFLQALGITAYCVIVSLVMSNGEKIFGQMKNPFAPAAFLIMFSVSALICGLIVFYKPYKLFFDGKKKEAVDIVVATAISLFVSLIIFFGVLALVK
jgi:uncharacterized membrane protein YesL